MARLGWLWYEPLTAAASVAADVIPTLSALREGGVRLGIVCNTPLMGDVIDKHLAAENLLEFFPVRIYSSDVGYRKPDRRIFQAALEELAIRPAEALYVGDIVKTDVVGAQRAGMAAVLRTGRGVSPKSGNGADFVIGALSQLLALEPVREAMGAGREAKVSVRSSVG